MKTSTYTEWLQKHAVALTLIVVLIIVEAYRRKSYSKQVATPLVDLQPRNITRNEHDYRNALTEQKREL
jgi:hypothetical protein